MKGQSVSLVKGNIYTSIIKFALPIFWGNLFQQLYHAVDAFVVGRYDTGQALAAVTSIGPLMFLFMGFFIGLYGGVGVVISKYYGANDYENVKKSVSNAVLFGIVSGIIMTILGTVLVPHILRLMGTPEDVFSQAVTYLRIVFAGSIFTILYNTANGIFQAVGDSKHPLYYLMLSSVINIVLDVVFVIIFKWGVLGVGIATIISQLISVILAFSKLMTIEEVYKVDIKNIKPDFKIIKEMIRIGLPSGIQNSVISLANIVVQSNINEFGSIAMAGSGAYSKVEGFAFIPIVSFSMSMTTFIGQNLGAKNYDRAKAGAKFAIITCVILAQIIGIVLFFWSPTLIGIFRDEIDIINIGVCRAKIISLFYFILAFSHCSAGILRGAGKAKVPMLTMLICWCIIRVTYITIGIMLVKDIKVIFWAYPLTWFLSAFVFIIYLYKSNWVHGLE